MSPQLDTNPLAFLSQQEQTALFHYLMNGGTIEDHVQLPTVITGATDHQWEEGSPRSTLSSYLVPPQEDSFPIYVQPNKRLRSGNSTPRPANCFILFRRHVGKFLKLLEHDHRLVSRLAGHCWNHLPESGKIAWRRKAEREKIAHKAANPGYTYTPVARRKIATKRKVKRNEEKDLKRCKKVADFLLAGKVGSDLHQAVKSLDASLAQEISAVSEPVKHATTETDPHATQEASPTITTPLLPSPPDFPGTPTAHESLPLPVHHYGLTYNDPATVYGEDQVVHEFPVFTQPAVALWNDYYMASGSLDHYDVSHYPAAEIALDGSFRHFDCNMSYIPHQYHSVQPVFDPPNWFPSYGKQFAEQAYNYIAPY